MKKILFVLFAAVMLISCGGNGNEAASADMSDSASLAAQQLQEQAMRDSIEAAQRDSIANAEKEQKAKEEAAKVKRKMKPAYYKATGEATLYSGPGEENSVVRSLKSGTVVTLDRVKGVWCHVRVGQDGPSGWVNYKDLKYYMPFEEYD